MREAKRMKVNVLEMKGLRSLVRLTRINRLRKEEVFIKAEIERLTGE